MDFNAICTVLFLLTSRDYISRASLGEVGYLLFPGEVICNTNRLSQVAKCALIVDS